MSVRSSQNPREKKSHRDLISDLLLIYFLIVALATHLTKREAYESAIALSFYENHRELIG